MDMDVALNVVVLTLDALPAVTKADLVSLALLVAQTRGRLVQVAQVAVRHVVAAAHQVRPLLAAVQRAQRLARGDAT
jgi:hypothetical protein